MPTISQLPGDNQWVAQTPIGTAGTVFSDYPTAFNAAVALSSINANAPVTIAMVSQRAQTEIEGRVLTHSNGIRQNPSGSQTNLPPAYLIQLVGDGLFTQSFAIAACLAAGTSPLYGRSQIVVTAP